MELSGVKFDDKHCSEFGLIMTNKTISSPEPQTKLIEVPTRNGLVDMSEVATGDIRYKNRTITIDFVINKDIHEWTAVKTMIDNYIHGRKFRIIFDDDMAFYYWGRCITSSLVFVGKDVCAISIECDCDPYKYNITTTADDWLWDTFDFEMGIINELSSITVFRGSKDVSIICSRKWENPIIVCDNYGSVTFNGKTYQLEPGSHVMYDIILTDGENVLTLKSNNLCTFSIVYRGGCL